MPLSVSLSLCLSLCLSVSCCQMPQSVKLTPWSVRKSPHTHTLAHTRTNMANFVNGTLTTHTWRIRNIRFACEMPLMSVINQASRGSPSTDFSSATRHPVYADPTASHLPCLPLSLWLLLLLPAVSICHFLWSFGKLYKHPTRILWQFVEGFASDTQSVLWVWAFVRLYRPRPPQN